MEIKADDFSKELAKALSEYTNDVKDEIKKEVKNTATEMVKDLRTSKNTPKRTGEYAKGFTKKKGSNDSEYIVYNNKKPSLTHLLEKGHAQRGGGRVKAYPHIEPAYNKAVEKLEGNIEKLIVKGRRNT